MVICARPQAHSLAAQLLLESRPAAGRSQRIALVPVAQTNLRCSVPTHNVSGSLFEQTHKEEKIKTKLEKSPEAFQLLWVVLLTLITIVCFCCGIYHKIIGLDIG